MENNNKQENESKNKQGENQPIMQEFSTIEKEIEKLKDFATNASKANTPQNNMEKNSQSNTENIPQNNEQIQKDLAENIKKIQNFSIVQAEISQLSKQLKKILETT